MVKRAFIRAQVSGGGDISVSLKVLMPTTQMVRGYVLATRRLRDAVNRSHAYDIYAGLFEATNWLDSLSERDAGFNSRAELKAMKFARHRTHHQWAAAVRFHDGEWRWRPLSDLPVPKEPRYGHAKLKPFYKDHLEGELVVDPFDVLEPSVIALARGVDLT